MSVLPSHIFVVGASRSGTKFLQYTLLGNPQIHITQETHYFSKLIHDGFIKVAGKIGDLTDDRCLEQLLDRIYNQKIFGTFWKVQKLDRERLSQRLRDSDRSFRSIFEIILDEDRALSGKKIPGEKTPGHVFHVDTLLEWFPDARIIQIVRDPRAVLSSEIHKADKPDYPLAKGNILYGAGLLVTTTLGWYLAIRKDGQYRQRYPRHYVSITYEALLMQRESTVHQLCDFLGIDFDPAMLNPPIMDSSYGKRRTEADVSVLDQWRNRLPAWMPGIMNFFLKRKMQRFGYSV